MTTTEPQAVIKASCPLDGKVKGTDFCGTDKLYFIRSDMGCYLEFTDSNELVGVRDLHESCSGGDHYLAYWHSPFVSADYPYFFIIYGDVFRRVKNLTTAEDLTEDIELHEKCRGGDHYIGTSTFHVFTVTPSFIIIFSNKGFYRIVSDLRTADNCSEDLKLDKRWHRGLYYWSTKSFWRGKVLHYRLTKEEREGIQLYYTTDKRTNAQGGSRALPDKSTVSKFLKFKYDSPSDSVQDEIESVRRNRTIRATIWRKVKECKVMIQGWAIGITVLTSAVILYFAVQHLQQYLNKMQAPFYPSSGQEFDNFSEPSIHDLKSYLTPHVAVYWREIGQGLKIGSGKLNNIEANNAGYPNQQERCLGNVFETWREENAVISWKTIVEVLLSQHLNLRRTVKILYDDLKDKQKHG